MSWGELEPGPHHVGLTTAAVDSVRELVLWYPASPGGSDSMAVGDYLELLDRGVAVEQGAAVDAAVLAALISPDAAADTAVARTASWRVAAARGAADEAGRFPLVLWSARHDVALYQSVLSEYLASHGYVVAAVRRIGQHLPPPWRLTAAERPATLEQHTDDLVRGLRRLAQLDRASDSYAVLAWSFGGESAMALALDSTVPDPVVLLSLSSTAGSGWLYDASVLEGFLESDGQVPLVSLAEVVRMDGSERPVPEWYLEGELPGYYLIFPAMGHGDFNYLEGYLPSLAGIESVQPWAKGGAEARQGYPVVARLTRQVLDHYLRDPADSSLSRWPPADQPGIVELVPR